MKNVSTSFSGKSKKLKNLPPLKEPNLNKRSREYLTPDEVKQIAAAAKETGRYGFRDSLLITIAYKHALRVGEVIDLKWDQVDLDRARLHVNRLKSGDASIHYLEGDEVRWLRKLQRTTPSSSFVFTSERKGPLTASAVYKMISRAGELAGIKFRVHPHMLRHGKGYQLASRGIDTRAIQAYFGHRNIQHTVIYTKLDPSRFKGFGRD